MTQFKSCYTYILFDSIFSTQLTHPSIHRDLTIADSFQEFERAKIERLQVTTYAQVLQTSYYFPSHNNSRLFDYVNIM